MDKREQIEKLKAQIAESEARGEVADPELYFSLGILYYHNRELVLTEEAWQKTIQNARSKEQAGHPGASYSLGVLLGNHFQRYDDARTCYEEAISAARSMDRAGYPIASFNLGLLLTNHFHQYEEAIVCYKEAISNARSDGWVGHPKSSFNLGVLLSKHFHQYEEAIVCYKEAISDGRSMGQAGFPRVRFNLGVLLSKHFYQHEEAIVCYEKAISDARSMGQAGHPEASTNLGLLLTDHFQRYDDARMCYEDAISDARSKGQAGLPHASTNLGLLLTNHFQRYDDARMCYEDAISNARTMGQAGVPPASYNLGVLLQDQYQLFNEARESYIEASSDAGGVFIPAHLALAKMIKAEEPNEALRLAAEVACEDAFSYGAVELLATLNNQNSNTAIRYSERKALILQRLYSEIEESTIDGILKDRSLYEVRDEVSQLSLEKVRYLLAHLSRNNVSSGNLYRIVYLLLLYTDNTGQAYHILDDSLDTGDVGHELSTIDKLLHLSLAQACAEPQEEILALRNEYLESETSTAAHDELLPQLSAQIIPVLSVPDSPDCYLYHYEGISLAEVKSHLKTKILQPEGLCYNLQTNQGSNSYVENFAIKLSALILSCWVHEVSLVDHLQFDTDELRKQLLDSEAAKKAQKNEDAKASLSLEGKKALEDLDQAAHSDKWTLSSVGEKLSTACTKDVPLSLLMYVLSETKKIPGRDLSKLRLYALYCTADQLLRSGNVLSSEFVKESANELVASTLEGSVAVVFTAFGFTMAGPIGLVAGGVSGWVAKSLLKRARAHVLNEKDRIGIEEFLADSSKELDKLERVMDLV